MNLVSPPRFGFLPSLEAMPLVRILGGEEDWLMCPRTGYGNIIRSLLTGALQIGLVPWELLVTELLLQPGQAELWAVVQAIHQMPVELVLNSSARKRLYPAKSNQVATPCARLIFAIESKRSISKLKLNSWLSRFPEESAGKPLFRMLPMEMMLKGLGEHVIDGMMAPTPWGMQAETMGVGKLDLDFEGGRFGQQMVLVCRRKWLDSHPKLLLGLPARTTLAQQQLLADSIIFRSVVERMKMMGAVGPTLGIFEKAAALYRWPVEAVDVTPDQAWLEAELQRLVVLMLVPSDRCDVKSMASRLVFKPSALNHE